MFGYWGLSLCLSLFLYNLSSLSLFGLGDGCFIFFLLPLKGKISLSACFKESKAELTPPQGLVYSFSVSIYLSALCISSPYSHRFFI